MKILSQNTLSKKKASLIEKRNWGFYFRERIRDKKLFISCILHIYKVYKKTPISDLEIFVTKLNNSNYAFFCLLRYNKPAPIRVPITPPIIVAFIPTLRLFVCEFFNQLAK